MAGAGFKTFAVNEVLTAENVNTYLMQQSVMVFADSAARGSALGTAVSEGMLTYLSDEDSVEVYDGSSWVGVGLPLGTATPTDGQFLSYATATSTWDPVDTPIALGTATPTDGQILAFGTATSTWNPTDPSGGFDSVVTITATNASWPVPASADGIFKITVIGGGGGGGETNANGGTGGTSSFVASGVNITASGGLGGGRSNGSSTGNDGTDGFASGNGGEGRHEDSSDRPFDSGDGRGGAITVDYANLSGISTANATIGAGGAGATGAGDGGRGEIIVEYRAA